jgi:hypothetical protein
MTGRKWYAPDQNTDQASGNQACQPAERPQAPNGHHGRPAFALADAKQRRNSQSNQGKRGPAQGRPDNSGEDCNQNRHRASLLVALRCRHCCCGGRLIRHLP